MKNLLLTGALSILTLTACKKDDTATAQKTLEQEKIEFQARQLEIEKQSERAMVVSQSPAEKQALSYLDALIKLTLADKQEEVKKTTTKK